MFFTRTLLAMSLIASLAIGCGGDDPGTHVDDPDATEFEEDAGPDAEDSDAEGLDSEDPDVEDPDTDVDPNNETGALSLTVEGLPDGEWPEITLSGDDGDVIIGDDGMAEDLVEGNYSLSAAPLTIGLAIYEAAPVELTIQAEQTTDVTLSFELMLGELVVEVEGLPEGLSPDLILTHPEGTETSLIEAGTLTDQIPGTYAAVANDVTEGPAIYRAEDASVDVSSDQSSTLTITYAVVPGVLAISASGLPNDVALSATLVGPAPSTHAVPVVGDQTLEELAPGTYTLNFEQVSTGSEDFAPNPTSLDVIVSSDQSAQASTTYVSDVGVFTVAHDLPDTGSVTVRVSDSLDSSQDITLSGSGTRSIALEPGSYELTLVSNDLGSDVYGNAYLLVDPSVGFSISGGQAVTSSLVAQLPTEVIRGDDQGTGSLREVIDRVVAGSVITFADGLSEVAAESTILIDKELSIIGPGPDQLTLTTTGAESLFSFGDSANVHLEELRIADITSAVTGGAIVSRGVFSLRSMAFDNNQVTGDARGGAIAVTGFTGDIVIEDTVFTSNLAERGGALFIVGDNHDVYLERVRFDANESSDVGGAIFCICYLTVADAVFTNNRGGGQGGAIHVQLNRERSFLIERSLFANNSSDENGGAIFAGVDSTLKNVTFHANSANWHGGAYYQFDGATTMTHVTFADNVARWGSALTSYCDSTTTIDIKSSVFVGSDTLFDCARSREGDWITSGGFNYVQTDSAVFVPDATTDQVGTTDAPLANPLLALADNGGFSQTIAIDPTSLDALSIPAASCTDAAGQPVLEDQRAEPRPTNGFCTIGAYETDTSASP